MSGGPRMRQWDGLTRLSLGEGAAIRPPMTSTTAESIRSRPASAHPDAPHARALRRWLCCVALPVWAWTLAGGARRLPASGLSIPEWRRVPGIVPPLSDSAWQDAFDSYQKIPEYLERKRGMTLAEFKTIYW